MPSLESVLDQSLSRASKHSKKIYGKNPLSPNEVIDLVNAKKAQVLAATIRPNGQPHLSPASAVSLDKKVYVGIDMATARYKNLKRNPRLTLMIMEGYKRQAIIEGKTRFLRMNSSTAKRVNRFQKKKYGWGTDNLVELVPSKAFTYKSRE